jgi:hypothetical protein
MTTLKVGGMSRTTSIPRTVTEHPPVWPFPTYRGQPYRPPEQLKQPKKRPVWETAPAALF